MVLKKDPSSYAIGFYTKQFVTDFGSGRSPGVGNGNNGKFHGQRSLMGYSPWGHKSQTRLSNQTQWLTLHLLMQDVWVSSMVKELRSHMLQGVAKKFF